MTLKAKKKQKKTQKEYEIWKRVLSKPCVTTSSVV